MTAYSASSVDFPIPALTAGVFVRLSACPAACLLAQAGVRS
ncbi:hypothetical protein [Paraburkholderia caballeronis]|nr:hypothetical protein [Paraburkholderia caballeronis]